MNTITPSPDTPLSRSQPRYSKREKTKIIRLLFIIMSITIAGCGTAPVATETPDPTVDYSSWQAVSTQIADAPLYMTNDYTIILRDEYLSYRHGSLQKRILLKRARDQTETVIADRLSSNIIFSPDGEWLAFATRDESVRLTLYRVRVDGSGLEALTDKTAFRFVGVRDMMWKSDGWIQAEFWNGQQSDLDSSWPPYRLSADGSGIIEAMS